MKEYDDTIQRFHQWQKKEKIIKDELKDERVKVDFVCNCELKLNKCMWPGQCKALGHWDWWPETENAKIGSTLRIKLPKSYEEEVAKLHNQKAPVLTNAVLEMMKGGKENKMTRNEAHKIVFNKCYTMEGKEVGTLLDALEALGLIKFEEEVTPKQVITDARSKCHGYDEFIEYLDKYGYKIVKK